MTGQAQQCETCGYSSTSQNPNRARAAFKAHKCDFEHGTRAGFVKHHKRGTKPCSSCADAGAAYHRDYWKTARRFVEGTPDVPIGPVLRHVERLRSARMSNKRIALAAGVSVQTVDRLERRARGVRPDTARRILAVLPAPYFLPAEPARRRVRALAAIGWNAQAIADRAGLSIAPIADLTAGRTDAVEEPTDVAIRRVYDELCMTQGPSVRVRGHARRKGWAPPLAWDDIDHDPIPAMEPSPDGGPVLADIEWLAETGEDLDRAAARLGLHPASLERRLSRDNRHDLARRLRANGRSAA